MTSSTNPGPSELWPHVPPAEPPVHGSGGLAPTMPIVPGDGGSQGQPSSPLAQWSPSPPTQVPLTPRRRWGCGDIAYGLLITFALGFVFLVPLEVAGVDPDSLAILVFGAMSVWIGLGGWSLFCSWVKGEGRLRLDFGWAFRWFDVFIGAGLSFATLVVLAGLAAIQQSLGVHAAGNTQFLQNEQRSGVGWTYVGLTLMVAVAAPLVEELFFRGLTYSALRNRFGRVVAVAGSSLIFGFMHFQAGELVPTLFMLLNLSVVGLVLGSARMAFGRTGPGVFMHMFFNLTAALAILAG